MDDLPDHDFAADTPAATPQSPATTAAAYIPRPPNAFILFRSAFIRSNRITGRVEGNHSTLSRIIGAVWRSLPPHEREEWEAKARVALDEHKRRYPDWRFVNAQVRRGRGREGDGRGRRGRGRGKRRKTEGERVEMIRDLLVEGVEGEQLEKAVEDWERSKRTQQVSLRSFSWLRTLTSHVCQSIASTSAQDPYATIQTSPYHTSPYQATSNQLQQSPSAYSVSNFSSLSNWAGHSPSPPFNSPTSATFPSSSYPTYSEFVNTEFNYYTPADQPPAVSYEEPTYDNPYSTYSAFPQTSDAIANAEPDYLPVDVALPLPVASSSQEQPREEQEQYVWMQPWQSPPMEPPRRKGRQPVATDEYGWEVTIMPGEPHSQ